MGELGSCDGHSDGGEDYNARAIFLHILGDFAASIGVIISACFIKFTDWESRFLFDPVLSIIVSVYVIYATWPLCAKTTMILMQQTPDEISLHTIESFILEMKGVLEVEDLHVWQLNNKDHVGSVKVLAEAADFSSGDSNQDRSNDLTDSINQVFKRNKVSDVTVQLKFVRSKNKSGVEI